MVIPSEKNDKIIIARSIENDIQTTGSVSVGDTKVVTIIAKNNTSSTIKLNVGVSSSEKSTDSIEYLGGKKLISGTTAEADYYYDEATSKYISTTDSSISFTTDSTIYSYTGSSQTYTPNHDGSYKLEAWGARGGSTNGAEGGKGAYASGVIDLKKSENIYMYLGEFYDGYKESNSFNGGGHGGYATTEKQTYNANGGGATDFRLVSGDWNNATSLASRIMVASGGGGGSTYTNDKISGGSGGSLIGGVGTYYDHDQTGKTYTSSPGATQTSGGIHSGSSGVDGGFGYGGYASTFTLTYFYYSGGGGGYYGGSSGGVLASGVVGGASGGSSYISGYKGCVAITSANNITPKAGCSDGTTNISCSYHYSGKKFINTVMKSGNEWVPNKEGTKGIVGNSGGGFTKVTPLVPNIDIPSTIKKDSALNENQVTCKDNGSGCQIVRITDTTYLSSGTHNINIFVKDDLGYIYRYTKTINIQNTVLLNEVKTGSYVKYIGNNGCSGTSCEGQNANYINSTNMGYCADANYKFNASGWRVGYIRENTAYLISAGAPECICTNSDGSTSSTNCTSYETTNGTPTHLKNINNAALRYCNSSYAYNGVCNSSSTWAFGSTDFKYITGTELSKNFCYYLPNAYNCGYSNDLIDNGGHSWYNIADDTSPKTFYWSADVRLISGYSNTNVPFGFRPVLRLKASIVVTSGTGTHQDPYIISP